MRERHRSEAGDGAAAEPRVDRGSLGRTGCLVAVYGPVLLIAVSWIVMRDGWSGPGARVFGGSALISLVAGAVLGAAVSWLLHGSPGSRRRPVRRMRRFFRGLLPGLSTSDAWALALASGIAEEFFFRGALQPELGLLATSAIFGVLHFPPDRRLASWPVMAALLGLAFGGLAEVTGSLLGPMVAHVTINLLSLRRLVDRANPPLSE